MTTEPGTGAQPPTMTTSTFTPYPDEWAERFGQALGENARVRSKLVEALDLARRFEAQRNEQLSFVEEFRREADGLHAKLVVVEKQRDEAQTKVDVATSEWEAMLASLEVSRTQRDEARGQRDALVAEVERIANDFATRRDPDSGAMNVYAITAIRLRQAIAKTTPQPPPQDPNVCDCGIELVHAEATRYARERNIAEARYNAVLVERDHALAERDAAVKARDEATATIAALRAANDEQGKAVTKALIVYAERDELRGMLTGVWNGIGYPGDVDLSADLPFEVEEIRLQRDDLQAKVRTAERDLAEARGETQHVRDRYRAHTQQLRDGVARFISRFTQHESDRQPVTQCWEEVVQDVDELRALLADTAQAAANTGDENSAGEQS